jgi:hypothetical protein
MIKMNGNNLYNPMALSNPEDQKWMAKFQKFQQIFKYMLGTIDSFKLIEEVKEHPYFKKSKLINQILDNYMETQENSFKFYENQLKEFKDFIFIIPSNRDENKIKDIPPFTI